MPNSYASDYYKQYDDARLRKALSLGTGFPQVQSVGTYKLVVFMGMPGEKARSRAYRLR